VKKAEMAFSNIPPSVWDALGLIVAAVIALRLLAWLPSGFTLLRRSIRHALISQRVEGWGGSGDTAEEIGPPPVSPLLDRVMTQLFSHSNEDDRPEVNDSESGSPPGGPPSRRRQRTRRGT
jgi:hypothetical protein